MIPQNDWGYYFMITYDLHYHLNFHKCSKDNRKQLLLAHRNSIELSGVNYVASTEHIYKNALEAYLYLCDICSDISATIIPGVEWISSEGVEIIFLYDSEASLRSALKILKPFGNSVFEFDRLKEDTGGIGIIPHPFTPGKTGVARLGSDAFMRLLKKADYVEVHNGLSVQIMRMMSWKFTLSHVSERLQNTFALPDEYKLHDVGWSVGSDAHFPYEQFMVGVAQSDANTDWYNFLRQRIHFSPVATRHMINGSRKGARNGVENFFSVIREAFIKKRYRVISQLRSFEKRS
jgi:hypothetical protein